MPNSRAKPEEQDCRGPADPDPARRRFRRIAVLYLAVSAVVAIVMTALAWDDLPGMNVQLVVVMAIYWLLPLPVLRVLLDWRRLGRRAILGGVITIIAVVGLLELLGLFLPLEPSYHNFHLGGMASRHLHHVMPADTVQAMSDHAGGKVLVRTNEDGFRTDYSRSEFLAMDRRIAVMGDSFIFGYFVAQEDTIPAQLEGMLRDTSSGGTVAVLNAGVISYSPLIHRQVFRRKIAAYRPALTIVCLDVTDIGDDVRYDRENIGSDEDADFGFPDEWAQPKPALSWQPMTLRVLRTTRLTFPFECLSGDFRAGEDRNLFYDYYDFNLEVAGKMETDRFFVLRHPLDATRPFFESTWQHVLALRDMCHANGSEFLLVLLPRYFHWNRAESPENWEVQIGHYRGDESYRFVFFDFFERQAAQDRLAVLNLLPAFRVSDEFPLCHHGDPHYNGAGCRVAASAIFEYLRSNKLLDPKTERSTTPANAENKLPPPDA